MKHGHSRSLKFLTVLMAMLTLSLGVTPTYAGIVESDVVISTMQEHADTLVIQETLENKLVQAKLKELGFTQAEVHERLARLDASQRHELALKIQEAETAAGHGVLLGIIVIAAIIAIVYFVVHEIDHDHAH